MGVAQFAFMEYARRIARNATALACVPCTATASVKKCVGTAEAPDFAYMANANPLVGCAGGLRFARMASTSLAARIAGGLRSVSTGRSSLRGRSAGVSDL